MANVIHTRASRNSPCRGPWHPTLVDPTAWSHSYPNRQHALLERVPESNRHWECHPCCCRATSYREPVDLAGSACRSPSSRGKNSREHRRTLELEAPFGQPVSPIVLPESKAFWISCRYYKQRTTTGVLLTKEVTMMASCTRLALKRYVCCVRFVSRLRPSILASTNECINWASNVY